MEPQASVLLSVNIFVAELFICKAELVVACFESGLRIKFKACSR